MLVVGSLPPLVGSEAYGEEGGRDVGGFEQTGLEAEWMRFQQLIEQG